MTISDEEEYRLLKSWFSETLIQAFQTLPKVLDNPKKASREMNRLERHSVYQLHRAIELERGVTQ